MLKDVIHDGDSGRLLTRSLLDYRYPRADDLSSIAPGLSSPVASLSNPRGIKCVGEGGTVAATPTAMNAIVDALAPLGVTNVTACANAYVWPLMDRYLKRLELQLNRRGFTGALRLMHSAGGLVSPETARNFPVRLLESGPAGGALATALFGRLAGKGDVISFDMGGTTAKTCMIADGRIDIAPMLEAARVHRFRKGSGLPIRTPAIDMIEIGAGGVIVVPVAGAEEAGYLYDEFEHLLDHEMM